MGVDVEQISPGDGEYMFVTGIDVKHVFFLFFFYYVSQVGLFPRLVRLWSFTIQVGYLLLSH